MDSTRPINDASGDDHVLTDIWSVHNYEQDGTRLSEQLIFKGRRRTLIATAAIKKYLAVYEGQPLYG